MDRRHLCAVLGFSAASTALGGEEKTLSARPGAYVVSPNGPTDGGDFGPRSAGTATSGLQEAFDACKRDRRDLLIIGGGAAKAFENPGGVYTLTRTLRIPWMQDFRCDGGEAVLQYTEPTGDAIVMDSQMSTVYKFGLIALPAGRGRGACLRIEPKTLGPDNLPAFVANRVEVNALVGGGSRGLEEGKFIALGEGLVLDSSHGGITNNKIFVQEIIGCAVGIQLTAPGPQTAVLNNWIDCNFAHICQTHLRLGNEGRGDGVLWNRIAALCDGDTLEGATGAEIFGRGNWLRLTLLRAAAGRGLVFAEGARENDVEVANLQGSYTDRARNGTNRVKCLERAGLGVTTPTMPPSGEWCENLFPATIEVMIETAGDVSEWSRQEREERPLVFTRGVMAGESIYLRPNEKIRFTYAAAPRWMWRVRD